MISSGEDSRDKGWAWMVLAAAFFNLVIAGIPFCIGVYVNEIILELNVDHATGGLFGALQLAALYLGGPATFISERYSYRVVIFAAGLTASSSIVASIFIKNIYILFFTFATLPGFCIGVIFIQSIIVANQYFDKYAGMANAFSLAGCGLGTIVIPSLYDTIIEAYSWRNSLFIVAGITLQACIFALIMRPIELPRVDLEITKSQETKLNSLAKITLFKNPKFYLFLVSNTLWSASMSVVFVLGANLFYERGANNIQINILLAIVGFGNLGVRIVIGFLLHLRNWNVVGLHIALSILQSVSLVLFVVHNSFVIFAIASFLFGISYGSTTVTQAIVPRVIAGIHNYGTAYSFAIGFCVLGITGGPSLTGYIYDNTKSYETAFLVNSGFALSSALILSVSFYFDCKNRGNEEFEPIVVEPDTVEKPVDPLKQCLVTSDDVDNNKSPLLSNDHLNTEIDV